MKHVLPLHSFPASFLSRWHSTSHTLLRRATLPVLTMALLLLASGSLVAQGVTTGGVDGVVTNASALPLVGVTVTAVHQPSGTTYQTTTRSGGVFTIGGMRVGGPYTVTATILGHRQEIQQGVHLALGQSARLSFALAETAIELDALTVEAAQDVVLNSDRTGAATVIPQEVVRTMPTVRRSTRDLTRLDPRNDGNFSFGGRNWLYNNITLDGSYFNNSFGLDDPAPGGQSGSEPIPYDAVEQVVVQVAPFDVRQSGFTGANINTVTKSGTNEFKVTGFAFHRNDNLVGNSVSGNEVIANPELTVNQYGFSLGGPIIKDKLFFFFSGELTQRDDPGSNFVPSSGGTPAFGESRVEQSVLDAISERMATEYNFDTGPYSGFVHESKSNKALLKVDWNLNANNNLMFRYSRLDAERDLPPHPFAISSSPPTHSSGTRARVRASGLTGSSRATTGSTTSATRSAMRSRPSRSLKAASRTPRSDRSRSRSRTISTRTSCNSRTTSHTSRAGTA